MTESHGGRERHAESAPAIGAERVMRSPYVSMSPSCLGPTVSHTHGGPGRAGHSYHGAFGPAGMVVREGLLCLGRMRGKHTMGGPRAKVSEEVNLKAALGIL